MRWKVPAIIGLAAVATVGSLYVNSHHVAWVVEPQAGGGLTLAVASLSTDAQAITLRIHCDAHSTQVRLYAPIRVLPPAGQGDGRPTFDITEELRDDRTAPRPQDDTRGQWIVSDQGGFGYRAGSRAFIERLYGHQWLDMRSLVFRGDQLSSTRTTFPIKGLETYRDRIAAACPDLPE